MTEREKEVATKGGGGVDYRKGRDITTEGGGRWLLIEKGEDREGEVGGYKRGGGADYKEGRDMTTEGWGRWLLTEEGDGREGERWLQRGGCRLQRGEGYDHRGGRKVTTNRRWWRQRGRRRWLQRGGCRLQRGEGYDHRERDGGDYRQAKEVTAEMGRVWQQRRE